MPTLGSNGAVWKLIREARKHPETSLLLKVVQYRNQSGKIRYGLIFKHQKQRLNNYEANAYIINPKTIYERDVETQGNSAYSGD